MITKEIFPTLQGLRALLLDVDGVMTDTRLSWIEGSGWVRTFSVKDGYGVHLLKKIGLHIGIISAGKSESVFQRAKAMDIEHIYLGSTDKVASYEEIKSKVGFEDREAAFVGDDLFDIPLLKKVGFAATVPDAVREVKEITMYTTKTPGGLGAVREIADIIRYAKDAKNYTSFLEQYEASYP